MSAVAWDGKDRSGSLGLVPFGQVTCGVAVRIPSSADARSITVGLHRSKVGLAREVVPETERRPQVSRLSLPDWEMHVEQAGQGEPVVFVHGGFAALATTLYEPAEMVWAWEWAFADQFHFIIYE